MSMSRQQVLQRICQQLSTVDNERLEHIYNQLFDDDHIVAVGGDYFEQQDMVD